MVDKIYIARHGFRLNWVTTTWKSETGLPRDPPLAAFGVSQAQELANYLLSLPEEERPTAIFSSPYYRCIQTSKPVSKALDLPIYLEHGLSEWYSPVTPNTGLHPRPGSAETMKHYFEEIDSSWSSVYYPSRKGETVGELHDRASNFVKDFLAVVDQKFEGKHKRILLVSHAATVIGLVCALSENRNIPLRVGCCTLSELEKAADGWNAIKLADGSHLKEGVQRDWGLADIEIADGEVVSDPGEPGTEEDVDIPCGSQVSPRSSL